VFDVNRVGLQRDLAWLVGVDESTISDYVKRGVVRPGDTLAEQLRGVFSHLRAAAAGRVDPPGIAEQRERLLRAKAEAAELELRRKRGQLVDGDAVRRVGFSLYRAARNALLAWSARLAPLVAAESSQDVCARILTAEVERLCEDLAAIPEQVREKVPHE
jgi:phage terminase Nu1 subunit (DNA packaging protein)